MVGRHAVPPAPAPAPSLPPLPRWPPSPPPAPMPSASPLALPPPCPPRPSPPRHRAAAALVAAAVAAASPPPSPPSSPSSPPSPHRPRRPHCHRSRHQHLLTPPPRHLRPRRRRMTPRGARCAPSPCACAHLRASAVRTRHRSSLVDPVTPANALWTASHHVPSYPSLSCFRERSFYQLLLLRRAERHRSRGMRSATAARRSNAPSIASGRPQIAEQCTCACRLIGCINVMPKPVVVF